jgi:hypothetical protein
MIFAGDEWRVEASKIERLFFRAFSMRAASYRGKGFCVRAEDGAANGS